jgi:hypothetical protein
MGIYVFSLFYPEDGVIRFLRSIVIYRTARCDIPDDIDMRTTNLTQQSSSTLKMEVEDSTLIFETTTLYGVTSMR